jgi:cytochrome c peroxidase
MFIRFVLARRHPDSGVEDGTFGLAYELKESPHVEAADRNQLAEALAWFEKNLETPTRFNRTKSKGFYRRKTRGIAWFKDTATEHLARMHEIKAVLENYGHSVVMLSEVRVGYVTYEDTVQVVAEPFSDTQTG